MDLILVSPLAEPESRIWGQGVIPGRRSDRVGSDKIRREKSKPGWLSDLAPAFGPEWDPGVPGSSPTSAPCMEPASPSACVSASLSLCLSWINKILKKKKKEWRKVDNVCNGEIFAHIGTINPTGKLLRKCVQHASGLSHQRTGRLNHSSASSHLPLIESHPWKHNSPMLGNCT